MQNNIYKVAACWDEEAKVFISVSDIDGLHIEAKTLEEFEEVMSDIAPELIISNHIERADFVEKSLTELMPILQWDGVLEQCA